MVEVTRPISVIVPTDWGGISAADG
jgi:hypothetical protein